MKVIKGSIVLSSGILAGLYLANIGAGVVEIIPDNIPLVGNIDEFIASIIVMKAFAYFGLDFRRQEGNGSTSPTIL